jgi:predicted amidophosphoribosyltransferase
MEKYYEKKAIRNGAKRLCKKCDSRLSRYNESNVCAACQKKIDINEKNKLLRMINEIG